MISFCYVFHNINKGPAIRTSMKDLLATPSCLKIEDHEIVLENVVSYKVGVYEQVPIDFFYDAAIRLARHRGIEFDTVVQYIDDYFFRKKADDIRNWLETAPRIPRPEVDGDVPEYAKFLRIESSPSRRTLEGPLEFQPLKERINDLNFNGVRAILLGGSELTHGRISAPRPLRDC